MKVLWTVNTLNPEIGKALGLKSSHAISWVDAMSKRLADVQDMELTIACPTENNVIQEATIDRVHYIIVPKKKSENNWKTVIEKIRPDIIHAYGTEMRHNKFVQEAAEDIPVIVSLQGILTEYQRHYYAGIDYTTMLRYTPVRDLIRPSGFFSGRSDFIKRSRIEQEILVNARYVEGRSTWDRVSSQAINPSVKYYYCPRMLREPFYTSQKWNIENIERHTVFISQGNYPIKGIHFVFQAIAQLKTEYPDIKLVITGNDMFEDVKSWKRILKPGYVRYLYDLANKLDVMDNIQWMGYKNAIEMAEQLQRVNVAVIPSSIENAPNSLAEAMIVGTPCIASFVGGNMDMLEHNKQGYLYCYNEYHMLAEYINRIFSSEELAKRFSRNAIKAAEQRHNPSELVQSLLNIYNQVIADNCKQKS